MASLASENVNVNVGAKESHREGEGGEVNGVNDAQGLKAAGNKAFASGDLDQAFAVSSRCTNHKRQVVLREAI